MGAMKTLPRKQAFEVWQTLLDGARLEAFKVEVLQDYYNEDKSPSLDAWLAGDSERAVAIMKNEGPSQWHKNYAEKRVRKIRLHVVEKPFTPYIQWEIELYKNINMPFTNEEVLLVPKGKTNELDLPDGDFWIFDDKFVVLYHYRGSKVDSADIYDESDDVSRFLKLKKDLLSIAEPLKL